MICKNRGIYWAYFGVSRSGGPIRGPPVWPKISRGPPVWNKFRRRVPPVWKFSYLIFTIIIYILYSSLLLFLPSCLLSFGKFEQKNDFGSIFPFSKIDFWSQKFSPRASCHPPVWTKNHAGEGGGRAQNLAWGGAQTSGPPDAIQKLRLVPHPRKIHPSCMYMSGHAQEHASKCHDKVLIR